MLINIFFLILKANKLKSLKWKIAKTVKVDMLFPTHTFYVKINWDKFRFSGKPIFDEQNLWYARGSDFISVSV